MTTPYKRLFRERKMKEDPHCYYCGGELIYYKVDQIPKGKSLPHNFATIEHLIDRYDVENRAKIQQGKGHNLVLACYKCNHDRGEERTRSIAKEELSARNAILQQRKLLGLKTPRAVILKQAGFC